MMVVMMLTLVIMMVTSVIMMLTLTMLMLTLAILMATLLVSCQSCGNPSEPYIPNKWVGLLKTRNIGDFFDFSLSPLQLIV